MLNNTNPGASKKYKLTNVRSTLFLPPPQQRRFDSIAWLIQGNDTCGAAAFDGKQLLLATNQTEASPLVNAVIHYLQEVAQTSAKSPKDESSYKALKAQHVIAMEAVVRCAKAGESWGKGNLYMQNRQYRECFHRALKKITCSIRHSYFKEYLKELLSKHDDTLPSDVLDALQAGRITFISGNQGLHAELKIVEQLKDNPQKIYLGISKRCCLECERAIQAFNFVYHGKIGENVFLARDKGHLSHFPAQVPFFLQNDLRVQKEFLELYKKVATDDVAVNLYEIEGIFRAQMKSSYMAQTHQNSDSPAQTPDEQSEACRGRGFTVKVTSI